MKTKSNGTAVKADKARGRVIGAGDGAAAFKFALNVPLEGRLETVATVTTRYGERTRLTIVQEETGELVSAFMPPRWCALLTPEISRFVAITRLRDEGNTLGGVRYDVRVID